MSLFARVRNVVAGGPPGERFCIVEYFRVSSFHIFFLLPFFLGTAWHTPLWERIMHGRVKRVGGVSRFLFATLCTTPQPEPCEPRTRILDAAAAVKKEEHGIWGSSSFDRARWREMKHNRFTVCSGKDALHEYILLRSK